MIQISKDDLKSYREILSGQFGVVYQVNDYYVYKIYNPTLYHSSGHEYKNPALRLPRRKFYLLMKAGETLQYTDVLKDIIIMDDKFSGVVLPYYNEGTITDILGKPYQVKRKASGQIVRNAKELNDHFIYPMDYKLNNIMKHNGNYKLIDLDDPYTKVHAHKSSKDLKNSTIVLGDTIYTIFNEFNARPFTNDIARQLGKPFPNHTYDISDILEYLKKKDDETPFLIIDESTDLTRLKELLSSHEFRILYHCSDRNYTDFYYQQFIDYFENQKIHLFDFLGYDHFYDYYLQDYAPCEVYELKEKSFVKKK